MGIIFTLDYLSIILLMETERKTSKSEERYKTLYKTNMALVQDQLVNREEAQGLPRRDRWLPLMRIYK